MNKNNLIGTNITSAVLKQAYENTLTGNGSSFWVYNRPGSGITTMIDNMLKDIVNDGKHIAASYDGQILRKNRNAFDPMRGILAKLNGRNSDDEHDCSLFMPNVTATDQALLEFDKRIRKVASTMPLIIVFEHSEYFDIQDLEVILRFMDLLCKKNAPILLFLTTNPFVQNTWINQIAGWSCENKTREMQSMLIDYIDEAYMDDVTGFRKRYNEPMLPLHNMADVLEYMNLRFEKNNFNQQLYSSLFEDSNGNIGWLKEFINLSILNGDIKNINDTWQFVNYANIKKPRKYLQLLTERLKVYASIANQLDKIQFNSQDTKYSFWKNFIQSNGLNLIKFIDKTILRRDLYTPEEFATCKQLISNIHNQADAFKQHYSTETFDEEKLEYIIQISNQIAKIETEVENCVKFLKEIKESQALPSSSMAQSNQKFQNARKLNKSAEKLLETKQYFAAIKKLLQAESELRYYYGNDNNAAIESCTTYTNLAKAYHWLGCYKQTMLYAEKLLENAQKCNNDNYQAEAYILIGRSCYRMADFKTAIEKYNKALTIAQNANLNNQIAKCSNLKSLAHIMVGEFDIALDLLNKSIKQNQEISNQEGLISTQTNLGSYYRLIGETKKSTTALELAESMVINTNNNKLLAKLYNSIGLTYCAEFNWQDAQTYFHSALEIYTLSGDHVNIANCYNNFGIMYSDRGNYPKAAEFLHRAIIIDQTLDNMPQLATSYDNLGIVLTACGDYNNAYRFLKKSLAISTNLNNQLAMSQTFTNIGNLLLVKQEYDNAMEYFEKALEIDTKFNLWNSILADYNNIGNILFYQKEYDKAIDLYQKAENMAQDKDDQKSLAAVYNNLGNIYYDIEQYQLSENYYLLALTINQNIKDQPGEALNLSNLAAVYLTTNKIKKSIEYITQAIKIDEKIKDNLKLAQHNENLGDIFSQIREYDNAEKCYFKSLDIYNTLKMEDEIARCQNALSFCYENTNRMDKAIEILNKNLQFYKETGRQEEYADTCWQMAVVQNRLHNQNEFLKYYNIASEIYQKNKIYGKAGDILMEIGRIFNYKEEFKNAKEHFLKATLEYSKISALEKLAAAYCDAAYSAKLDDNINETIKYANIAINYIENSSAKNTSLHSKTLIALVGCYNAKKQTNLMVSTFETAIKILENECAKNDNIMVKHDLHTAYINGAEMMQENNLFNLAEKYLLRVIDFCKTENFKSILANAQERLGLLYEKLGRLKDALVNINAAHSFYKQFDDEENAIIDTLKVMARINQKLKNYNDACEQYTKTLELLETFDAQQERAEISNELALCYKHSGDYIKCIDTYKNAIKLYHETNQQDKAIETEIKIASTYLEKGKYQETTETIQKLLKYIKTHKNDDLEINALLILAKTYFKTGKYPDCIDKFFMINEIIIPTDNWIKLAENFYELSKTLAHPDYLQSQTTYNGKTAMLWQFADEYLQPVIKLGIQTGKKSLCIDAFELQSEIYINTNNTDKALESLQKALNVAKEIDDSKQIDSIQTKIEEITQKPYSD